MTGQVVYQSAISWKMIDLVSKKNGQAWYETVVKWHPSKEEMSKPWSETAVIHSRITILSHGQ